MSEVQKETLAQAVLPFAAAERVSSWSSLATCNASQMHAGVGGNHRLGCKELQYQSWLLIPQSAMHAKLLTEPVLWSLPLKIWRVQLIVTEICAQGGFSAMTLRL